MRRVVGVDPGERWVGYALLDGRRWVGGGVLDLLDHTQRPGDLGHPLVTRVLRDIAAAQKAEIVAVEVASVFHGHGPAAAIVDKARRSVLCARLAGRLVGDLGRDWPVREIEVAKVRERWIVQPGPVEAKARRDAGEKADVDGALLVVAMREIEGFPVREVCRGGKWTHEPEDFGCGGAYQLPKRGETVGRLRAGAIPHLVDAALVAIEAA